MSLTDVRSDCIVFIHSSISCNTVRSMQPAAGLHAACRHEEHRKEGGGEGRLPRAAVGARQLSGCTVEQGMGAWRAL